MKKVCVSKKNWRELHKLKRKHGFANVNAVIGWLLENRVVCEEGLPVEPIDRREKEEVKAFLDRYEEVSKEVDSFLDRLRKKVSESVEEANSRVSLF